MPDIPSQDAAACGAAASVVADAIASIVSYTTSDGANDADGGWVKIDDVTVEAVSVVALVTADEHASCPAPAPAPAPACEDGPDRNSAAAGAVAAPEAAALAAKIDALTAEVAGLRVTMAGLCATMADVFGAAAAAAVPVKTPLHCAPEVFSRAAARLKSATSLFPLASVGPALVTEWMDAMCAPMMPARFERDTSGLTPSGALTAFDVLIAKRLAALAVADKTVRDAGETRDSDKGDACDAA